MFPYAANITMTADWDLPNRGGEMNYLNQFKGVKRTALRLLCITVMITMTAVFTVPEMAYGQSYSEGTGTINSPEGVYVRSDAGTSNSIVTSIGNQNKVEILSDKEDSEGNLWYEIRFSGKTGYVISDYIQVSGLKPAEVSEPEEETPAETGDTEVKEESETSAETPEETEENSEAAAEEETAAEQPAMLMAAASASSSAYPVDGVISTGDGAYVRADATTQSSAIALLSYKVGVTIYGEKTGSDGYIWYQVSISGKTGYIRSDLVKIVKPEDTSSGIDASAMTDEEFDAYLKAQGFPADYISALTALHKAHPSWVFKAANTDLNFEDVITKESAPGVAVVASSLPIYYRSKAAGNYNSSTGTYISHDTGGWYTATPEVIRYYMDPRNFLDEYGIFQFMTHSFDSSTQTKSHLQTLVSGTFLSGAYPTVSGESSPFSTYSDAIYEAGVQSGVNPYVLASMIIVEQGASGYGASISGTEKGYEGLFNFFNVGAAAYSGRTAVANGLIYAGSSGSYGRPWNTRYKSILGGARFYYDEYVGCGQNTLYFKKFNVNNGLGSVATHQYMSNVQGAELEAYRLRQGYAGTETAITFIIPVYRNMPSSACALPTGDTGSTVSGTTATVIDHEGVNVRADAGTSYRIVMTLGSGSVASVLGSKKGTDGHTWLYLSYGGKTGYARADFFSVKGTIPSSSDSSSSGSSSSGSSSSSSSSSGSSSSSSSSSGSSSSSSSSSAAAVTSATGTVTPSDGVNVRTGAGTNYGVIMALMKGTKVTVTGSKKGTDGYTWYSVSYSGKSGYIRSDFLSVSGSVSSTSSSSTSSSSSSSSSSSATVTKATGTVTPSDGVNVRSDAGTSYRIVTALSKGTKVTVTGSKKGTDGYTWYSISYSGKSGYIRSDFLSVSGSVSSSGSSSSGSSSSSSSSSGSSSSGSSSSSSSSSGSSSSSSTSSAAAVTNATGTVTPSDGVNVRTGAGTNYGVIMALMKGTKVTVTGSKKGTDGYTWYSVSYSGKSGYIRSDFLSVSGSVSSSSSSSSVSKTSTGTVKPTDGVYVRSGAGTSYRIVTALSYRTKVTVTGSTKGSDGYTWYSISYSGKSGYIRGDLLSF